MNAELSLVGSTKPGNYLKLFIILCCIIVLATLIASVCPHANKHPEAEQIHKCLQDSGPEIVYRAYKNDPRYFLLCQFEPGRWGFEIRNLDGSYRTAFSPGDGVFNTVRSYVERLGTKFNGPLPFDP